MKKIFITGSTGFVGGHLKNHLTAKGYEVLAPARNDLADPFSPDTWRKALERAECDTVVHLIAKTHAPDAGDPSALPSYRRINVDITRALLEASKDLGVKKFVYLSSIKAVGEETPIDEPFTEEFPCRPEDCYGISKREAELLVLEYSNAINTVILRPPLIYGPGVKGNFLKLLNAVKRRIPLPFASIKNARSLLYVGNLVHVITTATITTGALDKIFHIADDEAVSTTELIRLMGTALGSSPRLFHCASTFLEKLGGFIGKKEMLKKLTHSLVVSNDRLKNKLPISLPYSLPEGVEATAAWLVTSNNQNKGKVHEK